MKYVPLVWAALWRKPARTIFTFLSIVVAFVLFAILSGIDSGFAHQVEIARLDRLYTVSRLGGAAGGGMPMPIAYAEKIAQIPGVTAVAPRNGLNSYFQDPKNSMHLIMADQRYFEMKPELLASKAQVDELLHNRTGAIISVFTAKKFGWKVGDEVPLISNVPTKDGGHVWTFKILSIVDDSERPGQARYFVGNYFYLDERRASDRGTVDFFIVRISDPNAATQVSRAIDNVFANSVVPTRTGSEKSYYQSDIQKLGDANFFTNAIVSAVIFMVLFLTANTMMQSVRERVPEISTMKALGFSHHAVLLLIVSESVLLCLLAAAAGFFLAKVVGVPLVRNVDPDFLGQMLRLQWPTFLAGFALAVTVALLSGLIPAVRAMRLRIVDGLAAR